MVLSSDSQITQHSTEIERIIYPLPPTFITLSEIKDCDPKGTFPQINPLPYYTLASQEQFSCEFYDKDHVAWTMYIFYELWLRDFGDPGERVKQALNRLEIRWGNEVKEVKRVYDISGQFLEVADVSGLMEDPYVIWVWAESDISNTSFIHELTHIALYHSCGSADPDHEGVEYLCWDQRHSQFIDDVNTELSNSYGL